MTKLALVMRGGELLNAEVPEGAELHLLNPGPLPKEIRACWCSALDGEPHAHRVYRREGGGVVEEWCEFVPEAMAEKMQGPQSGPMGRA